MKMLVAFGVVGLMAAAGSSAAAQDAYYAYDSGAHNYHNYHYPVDRPVYSYHGWPAVWSTGQAVVHYAPAYHHCHHGGCCGHHQDLISFTLF